MAPRSLFQHLTGLDSPLNDNDIPIIISQDCDIVCRNFELEPRVEFVVARPVKQTDGNFYRGKNPRRLQFEMDGEVFEIRSAERATVDRRLLCLHPAESGIVLPRDVAGLLPGWIAKRYTRAALPDALVDRLRRVGRDIHKILKRDGEFVSALFLQISSEQELADNEEYEITLTILAPDEAVAEESTGMQLSQLQSDVDRKLSEAIGVSILDVRLLKESDFSYAELTRSIEWDAYDDLSYDD